MPNDIYNKLILRGNWEDVKKIIGSDRKNPVTTPNKNFKPYSKFSFVQTVQPNELEIPSKYPDLFELQTATWGTKWNPWDVYIKKELDGVILKFQTAWDPPIKWLEKIIDLFPNITFSLCWSDEDFPRCGFVFSNPICDGNTNGYNKLVIKNYPPNSLEAVEFVKTHFVELYKLNIVNYKNSMILKEICEGLRKFNKNLELRCVEYDDKTNHPVKYIFFDLSKKIKSDIENVYNFNMMDKEVRKQILNYVSSIFDKHNVKIKIDNGIIISKIDLT